MNQIYTRVITTIIALAVLAFAVMGVLYQNNRTIDTSVEKAIELSSEAFARQRAEDLLTYERQLSELRSRLAENAADARMRVAAVDQRQRRDTQALIRRINQVPEEEVDESIAMVLEQSRERWPE